MGLGSVGVRRQSRRERLVLIALAQEDEAAGDSDNDQQGVGSDVHDDAGGGGRITAVVELNAVGLVSLHVLAGGSHSRISTLGLEVAFVALVPFQALMFAFTSYSVE